VIGQGARCKVRKERKYLTRHLKNLKILRAARGLKEREECEDLEEATQSEKPKGGYQLSGTTS